MNWNIRWSVVAARDLLAIPWRVAANVDAAVMAFAAGSAPSAVVERISPTDPDRVRLRLPGASVLLWLDRQTRTAHVARVLPNR